jgi:4-amino-4-deoxy-L-arabinose transferase-like glycosyltransferase
VPTFSIFGPQLPALESPDQGEKTEQGWSRRRELATLASILAVYLLLAFYGIDRQSLWEDEYNSVWRITASVHPMWKDGHGFLYFALLYLWSSLGTSEIVLRAFSVLWGAAAVCLVYAVGRALLDRRAALYGTLIFATSPYLISYSQEVRYITLTLVTTLLAMYAFCSAVSQRDRAWWWACGATSLLAFFTFLATLMIPLVQGLHLVASRLRRPPIRPWLVCQIVIFILFGLWFVNGTHFPRAFTEARASGRPVLSSPVLFPFSGEFNKVRAAVVPYTFFSMSPGFSLGPAPRQLYADRSLAPLLPYAPLLVLLAVLYGGLLLAGWISLRGRRDARTLLALWMIVPVLGAFAIAKALNVFYDVRYLAMILPAYVLLLAAGIGSFRRTGLQLLLLGSVLALHGAALANYYFDPQYAREDTRSAAGFLASTAEPGDAILVVGTLSSLPHYYSGNPPLVEFDFSGGPAQPLDERLRNFGANHDRIWLVQIRPWQVDREGKVKAALDVLYNLAEQRRLPGVEIYAYRASK